MRLLLDLQGAQTESRFRGIGRQARSLAIAMLEQGARHDISILLNATLGETADALATEFGRYLPRNRIHMIATPPEVFEREPANLWRMRAAELVREAAIAALAPDVLHISSLFEGVADDAVTSIGLMNSTVKTAVTLHDLIPLYDEPMYLGAEFMKRFFYRRLQSLKRADLLLAVSESSKREAEEMLQIPGSRISVILEAVESTFRPATMTMIERAVLRAKYKLPEKFIFYVGAIEARKNVELIIRAFAELPGGLRDRYAIAFGGRVHDPERQQLQTSAIRYGVPVDRIIFTGFIADEDLPGIYGLCDLFVFPSLHEGFGLPPLEAMACGAPTLAARNSSLPEVMGRDDLMFDARDHSELASRMAPILRDDAVRADVGRWCLDRAGTFSWPETGRRAIRALETLHARPLATRRGRNALTRKPRLAFVSPLPGDKSGVANYSAELLRELGCYYDVECIVRGTFVTDSWTIANFVLRDVDFFKQHYNFYDRVLYSFGNSEFHTHMFELLPDYPGVVILHDFFLSGVLDWMGNVGKQASNNFPCQLYLSHGLPALQYYAENGREAAAERYPANNIVFEYATGVLVHSQWSKDRARSLYGDDAARRIAVVPHLKAIRPLRTRAEARLRLGLNQASFIACSFGFVANTKVSDVLFDAWRLSMAGRAPGAILVFVGDNIGGVWGKDLLDAIRREAPHVKAIITGYADDEAYRDYLAAADIAVQLRRKSRGETSGTILDCLGAGLPVVINAHGPAVELPEDTLVKLPDLVTAEELARAIDTLFNSETRRAELSARAKAHILHSHHPGTVGLAVFDTIERFSTTGTSALTDTLMSTLRELHAPVYPRDSDFRLTAEAIAANRSPARLKCIFYDVTLLAEGDAHTGIERVVRGMLAELIARPPEGYRVEPVRIAGHELRYARAFVAQKLGMPADILPDSRLQTGAGDIYVTLEWAADRIPGIVSYLKAFRRRGGTVVIGIHDLLPMQIPHRFPAYLAEVAQRWFEATLQVADRYLCVSKAVAEDVVRFGSALKTSGRPIGVDFFHNAADIGSSLPTAGRPDDADQIVASLKTGTTFLMVGTVEPRKGHLQTLAAFDLLWQREEPVNLVVVGRLGWSMEAFAKQVEAHPQRGSRLFWPRNVSDQFLVELYENASALIAASEAEGFGLPIIEAAAHGLPVIARDIPVFREVAGEHAYYFAGDEARDLADAITAWMALKDAGEAPASTRLKHLNWQDSAAQFIDRLTSPTAMARI